MQAQSCLTLLWHHGLQPTSLLGPWGFPDKNTVVAFLTSRASSPPRDWTWVLLHCRQIVYHLSHQGITHRCVHISKLIKLFMLNMYSFVYVNHTSINFFFKKKVMYWDILSLRAGQLLFLSISPKVWVGHAGWFCPDVVHSCLWAHSQLGGRSGQGLLQPLGCPIYGNVSASDCCSVAQSCPTLCGHVSDFVSDSFPSA